jgi:hypothetical protein
MKLCETCKHWYDVGKYWKDWGACDECGEIGEYWQEPERLIAVPHPERLMLMHEYGRRPEGTLETHKSFGCVLHS